MPRTHHGLEKSARCLLSLLLGKQDRLVGRDWFYLFLGLFRGGFCDSAYVSFSFFNFAALKLTEPIVKHLCIELEGVQGVI
jgi:hypothetical protein